MEDIESSHHGSDDGEEEEQFREEEEEMAFVRSPADLIALLHTSGSGTAAKRTALRLELSQRTSSSDMAVLAGTLVTLGRCQLKISRVEVSCGGSNSHDNVDNEDLSGGDPDWTCPAARDLFLAIGGLPDVEGLLVHCLGHSGQEEGGRGNVGARSVPFGFPFELLSLAVCHPNSHWKYLHMDTVLFLNHLPPPELAENDDDQQQEGEEEQQRNPIYRLVAELSQALQQQASLKEFRFVHCQLVHEPPESPRTTQNSNTTASSSYSGSLNQVLIDPLIAAVSHVPTLECLTILEDATSVDNTAIEYGSNAHHNDNTSDDARHQRSAPARRVLIGLCKKGRLAAQAVDELFQWMDSRNADGNHRQGNVHLDRVRLWLSSTYPIVTPVKDDNEKGNSNLLLRLCCALQGSPTITDVRVLGANAERHVVEPNVAKSFMELLAYHPNYSLTALSLFSHECAASKVYLKANQWGRGRFVRRADQTMTRQEWLTEWIIPLVDACHGSSRAVSNGEDDNGDEASLLDFDCLYLFLRLQPLFLYAA